MMEFTREDGENIALTKKGVDCLTVQMAEIKELLKCKERDCETCKAGIDVEINSIKLLHAEQQGLTKGQAVAYGGIPAGILTAILTILELLKWLRGGPLP